MIEISTTCQCHACEYLSRFAAKKCDLSNCTGPSWHHTSTLCNTAILRQIRRGPSLTWALRNESVHRTCSRALKSDTQAILCLVCESFCIPRYCKVLSALIWYILTGERLLFPSLLSQLQWLHKSCLISSAVISQHSYAHLQSFWTRRRPLAQWPWLPWRLNLTFGCPGCKVLEEQPDFSILIVRGFHLWTIGFFNIDSVAFQGLYVH